MAGRKVTRKWQLVEREIEDQIADRVLRHKFPDWEQDLSDAHAAAIVNGLLDTDRWKQV